MTKACSRFIARVNVKSLTRCSKNEKPCALGAKGFFASNAGKNQTAKRTRWTSFSSFSAAAIRLAVSPDTTRDFTETSRDFCALVLQIN